MIHHRTQTRSNFVFFSILLLCLSLLTGISCTDSTQPTGNVIFIHPDGSSASMWTALRCYQYGPDSTSNWDRLERMGMYRSHVLNSTNGSSHGGATIHAYGVKVPFDTYGSPSSSPIRSRSGSTRSIMMDAIDSGLATVLINSGHICEPGTGVFVASSASRGNTDEISEQIIRSGVDIILSGGETMLLPEDVVGRHGAPGVRKDGKNLIQMAQELGYTVVYTREELLALDSSSKRVLGVFAAKHTFHDKTEEKLAEQNLPLYTETAPTVAEMTETALRLLEYDGRRFIMVVEEEGTDNFANANNASGTLEALQRADAAIGVALKYHRTHPETLIITAADSDAGGLQMYAIRDAERFEQPLSATTKNGAALDGITGTGGLPFVTAPDINGVRLHFGIAWSCYADVAGGIIARAHGLNSDLLELTPDNTDIYRVMYATLFGKILPGYGE